IGTWTRIGINRNDAAHQLARVFVARLQLKAGLEIAAAVRVAGRKQSGKQRILRFAVEPLAQGAQEQKERAQALLAVNDLEVTLLCRWRDENSADEILAPVADVEAWSVYRGRPMLRSGRDEKCTVVSIRFRRRSWSFPLGR